MGYGSERWCSPLYPTISASTACSCCDRPSITSASFRPPWRFPQLFPGAGLLILLAFITLVGLLTKLFVFNWVMEGLEHLFNQSPVTRLIYSSLKDLFSAFVGDKKKMFSQPVMVMLFKEAGIRKLGFVTKENLSSLGLTDLVAVYFPHSYNFSGNLYLVPRENITPLPQMHGADAMKFIVSGGVTEI